jgi:hypothetical protein
VNPTAPLAPPRLENDEPTAEVPARFLVLRDLAVSRAGNRVACRVRLSRGASAFEGEAREPDTELGRARAAARAALAAAEQVAPDVALGLEGLAITEFFRRRYIAVSVEGSSGRRHAVLSGMVAIDPARSAEEASALATLHAIDRWLGF